MKKFSISSIILALIFTILIVPATGYAVTDKVILRIEGMT
jgi:hypothetical protein